MYLLIAGFVAYFALLAALCLYALVKGGETERRFATIWLAGTVATTIAAVAGDDFRGFAWRTTLVDAAVLVALAHLAVNSSRFWPIWATAFHLAAFLSHFTALLQPGLIREVYGALQGLWGFPVLATLAIGLWRRRPVPTESRTTVKATPTS